MDKVSVNKEQFKNLIIEEAKRYISKDNLYSSNNVVSKSNRKIDFNKIESLISEMDNINKSITSILSENNNISYDNTSGVKNMEVKKINKRKLDVDSLNKGKNIMHINESEKDKWDRMLRYEIPSDDER